jgi:CBS domain-containing protein
VTLEQAAQVMIERNVGSLVVMRGGLVEGILTERDVLRAVASGCVPWTTPVQTRMTPRPVSVTPAEPVDEALALMRRGDFRHLPVVDHGTLVGIVSLRDFAEPPQIWRRHASEMGVLPDTGGEGTEISS